MESENPPRNIRFVAYTNEEPPHFTNESMGSRVHDQSYRKNGDNIQGMICLESLGYFIDKPGSQELPMLYGMPEETLAFTRSRRIDPTVGNYIAVVGDEQSASFLARFDDAFARHPIPTLPLVMPEMRLSDHFCYWDEDYPAMACRQKVRPDSRAVRVCDPPANPPHPPNPPAANLLLVELPQTRHDLLTRTPSRSHRPAQAPILVGFPVGHLALFP